MRTAVILLATGALALAAPATDADSPNGVGTGVTKLIAPPNEQIPSDCITDFPVNFGIAVEMSPIWTPYRGVDGVDGSENAAMGGDEDGSVNESIQAKPKGQSGSVAGSGSAPKAAGGSSLQSSPNAGTMNHADMVMKLLVGGLIRAPAAPGAAGAAPTAGPVDSANGDTTVTVRSTRYTTKTYTVSRLSSGGPAAPVATSQAYAAGPQSGNVIKAAVIRQIGDGQVQMPHKPTDVTIKPTQTPFSPLSSGAPRISQIGDGQIQAKGPTPKATAAPAGGSYGAPVAAGAGSGAGAPKAAPKGGSSSSSGSAPPAAPPAPAAVGGSSSGASMSLGSVSSGTMDHSGMNMKVKRQLREICPKSNTLGMTLKGSVLKDKSNRIGYAAGNMQFQFDAPPQAGALYTAGFSVCKFSDYRDSSKQVEYLGWGNSTDFYACNSGEFSNLYSPRLGNIGPIPGQCYKVKLTVTRFGNAC